MFSLVNSVRTARIRPATLRPLPLRAPFVRPALRNNATQSRIGVRYFSTTRRSCSGFTEIGEDGNPVPPETIFIVTEENFDEKVVQCSQQYPVLLECSVGSDMTSEVLQYRQQVQNAVLKEGGNMILAKLDAMKHPQMATDLGIQEAPTLMAICRQAPLPQKMTGVQPQEAVDEFIWSLMHYFYFPELKEILDQGSNLIKENNIPEASKVFNSILLNPKFKGEALALCGLAECALREGNTDTAQQLIDQVINNHPKFSAHPYVKQISSLIGIQKASGGASEDELLEKIQANPQDLVRPKPSSTFLAAQQAIYDLGVFYAQSGQYEKSFERMYSIIKADREWNEQAAKNFLIQTISSLGDSDVAKKGRKGLQNLWFC